MLKLKMIGKAMILITFLVALVACTTSPATTPAERPLQNNKEEIEKALTLKGDVGRGQEIYEELCQNCHQTRAHGDPSGTFPQIAGQHASVLIKQIADIRAGNRDNPTMYPYSKEELLTLDHFDQAQNNQSLANVAAYVESIPMFAETTKGPGTDLEHGEELYKKHCLECHGVDGLGKPDKYYPLIAGQNYYYLVRQFHWIQEGKRRNANKEMVLQIQSFNPYDISSVMDYVSRLAVRVSPN
ncbi:c-type cytochrome [Deltaproteobacteria bacterium TL4]